MLTVIDDPTPMPDVAERPADDGVPGPVAAPEETGGMDEIRQELKRARKVLAESRAVSERLRSILEGPSDQVRETHVLKQDDEVVTQAEWAA